VRGQLTTFDAHDPLQKNQPKHVGKPVFEKHLHDLAVTRQLGGELKGRMKLGNHISSKR
jgi:hypothetical protein